MEKSINHDLTILKQPARPANKNDLSVAHNLQDTLMVHQQDCLGMAANMIGISVAIIAVFVGPVPVIMLNPKITKRTGPYKTHEGCLSLSGERPCQRFRSISVNYQDQNFESHSVNLNGIVAETVQHEIDHLSGKII